MTGGVIAVDRAIDILNAFRWGDEGLSLAELANRSGLHKTTILRLAVSLQGSGMLARSAGRRVPARRQHPQAVRHPARLAAAGPRGAALPPGAAGQCRESASLFIRDGDARICLVRVEAEQSVRDSARRLLPLALDDTSSGLVLRGLGGDGVGAVEGPFRPIFTSGVTDPQTASLSAPVFDAEGDIVAAMTVSGPAFRLTGEVAERFASRLAAQAEAFSASLGYRAEMPPERGAAPARSRRTPRAPRIGAR